MVRELQSFGCTVHAHDPVADSGECQHEYGIALTPWDKLPKAEAIVAAVSHQEYLAMGIKKLTEKLKPSGVFADVKCAYDQATVAATGARLWRL